MGRVGESYEATWSASAIQAPSSPGSSMNVHDNQSWGLGDTSGVQAGLASHGGRDNTNITSPSSLSSTTSSSSSGGQMTQSSKWTQAVTQACNDAWTLWKLQDSSKKAQDINGTKFLSGIRIYLTYNTGAGDVPLFPRLCGLVPDDSFVSMLQNL